MNYNTLILIYMESTINLITVFLAVWSLSEASPYQKFTDYYLNE